MLCYVRYDTPKSRTNKQRKGKLSTFLEIFRRNRRGHFDISVALPSNYRNFLGSCLLLIDFHTLCLSSYGVLPNAI